MSLYSLGANIHCQCIDYDISLGMNNGQNNRTAMDLGSALAAQFQAKMQAGDGNRAQDKPVSSPVRAVDEDATRSEDEEEEEDHKSRNSVDADFDSPAPTDAACRQIRQTKSCSPAGSDDRSTPGSWTNEKGVELKNTGSGNKALTAS